MDENISFAEWRKRRVDRFVELALATPEEHREEYMRVQANSLVRDALRFSRAGLRDDDPMPRD
jgi:hypothetical protein